MYGLSKIYLKVLHRKSEKKKKIKNIFILERLKYFSISWVKLWNLVSKNFPL